jgi:4-amino-4-deoxy-L-arabinose transferase-like glycosyltransferase
MAVAASVITTPAGRTTAVVRPTGRGAGLGLPLLLILLAGAGLRLSLWWAFRDAPVIIADERDYVALGRTLAETGEYAFEPGGPLTSLRPPLYPLMVAAVYNVAGVGNLAAVRLVQVLLSLATAVILYRLGRFVLSPRGALWLTAVFVFYPSFLGYNNLILTETLFTLLLVASVFCAVRALQMRSVGMAWAAGLLLGLAALTRSVVWLAPPFLAAFVALALDGGIARQLAAAGAIVVGFAAVVAPWAVRNTRLQETFIAVDCMGGRNFMMGNYRYTPLYRSWDAVSLTGDQFWANELTRSHPDGDRSTQGKLDKLALRHGLDYVRKNPGLTAVRDAFKFLDFWGLERELVAAANQGLLGPRSLGAVLTLAVVICGAYAVVAFAGVFGLACAPPADRRVTWLLVSVIAFVCGLHTLTFAHSRYHLPVMPFVMVFAASAFAQGRQIWAQRGTVRFRLALAACLLLTGGWVWRLVWADRDILIRPVHSAVPTAYERGA